MPLPSIKDFYSKNKNHWLRFQYNILRLIRATALFIYNLFGIRAIVHKIWQPTEESKTGKYRAPSTFFLWFTGIYFAFFGIASQRYELSLAKLEARANSIITLSASDAWKMAIEMIPTIQNTEIPIPPFMSDPLSVLKSLFGKRERSEVVIDLLADLIRARKKDLSDIYLRNVILDGIDLTGANFSNSILVNASFKGADLAGSTFKDAELSGAKLPINQLTGVVFENARCVKTDFTSYKMDIKKHRERYFYVGDGDNSEKIDFSKNQKFISEYEKKIVTMENLKEMRHYAHYDLIFYELAKAQTLYKSIFDEKGVYSHYYNELKKEKPLLFKTQFPANVTEIAAH
jgi:hypothetical protein